VLSLGTPFLEAVTGKAAAACSHYLFAGISPCLAREKDDGECLFKFKTEKKRDRHLTLFCLLELKKRWHQTSFLV
jgi:hypothetical protein